ncbi:hypothetical protein E1176_18945 [Fulvivirga sp. RKSG066]|uniref:sigma factor-like helix-turn-helix DNA-binding protein n=1 Tax=Fulvivirga aurantia TaxID=2529383 RepID=UPI0012BC8447|nr:sigma factor-like helix-turn-helix DNA-binding protein [Fulvivirga aurantia]MTI23114.1 hypothetical protein [Fulvivirga aurantia]
MIRAEESQKQGGILFEDLKSVYENAYEGLPENSKFIYRLHKIDGFTSQEIGHLLDMSPSMVEAQLGKALKIMRDRIRKYQLSRLR